MAPRRTDISFNIRQRQTRAILTLARKLARSGEHVDHTTIIPMLEGMEGFEVARVRLEQGTVLLQLDRLCTLTRALNPTQGHLVELRRNCVRKSKPRASQEP